MLALCVNEARRAVQVIVRSPFETATSLGFLFVLAVLMVKGISWMSPDQALAQPIGGFLVWLTLTGFISGPVNDVVDDMEAGLLPHLFTGAYPAWLVVLVRTLIHGATGLVYGIALSLPLAAYFGAPFTFCAHAVLDFGYLIFVVTGAGVFLAGLAFVLPRSRVVTSLASFLLLPVLMFSGQVGSGLFAADCGSPILSGPSVPLLLTVAVAWNVVAVWTCAKTISYARVVGVKFA